MENDKEINEDEELHIMNKEDSKQIMRTKEFETFINKTSKIVERALTGSADVLGASLFLENFSSLGEGEDGQKAAELGLQGREKIVPLFTFQDSEPTLRTVTSIEWNPKVRL